MDPRLRFVKDLIGPLRVPDGRTIVLARDFDPGYVDPSIGHADADGLLKQGIELLVEYQDRLAAQDTYGVLLVLQGIDAAGKDSTIKHVMSGVNPHGVEVHGFKQPSTDELRHDFLWRHQRALPERGRIGIFNRSHYEEVLAVRVHPELLAAERLPDGARSGDVWKRRYREINEWERHLVDNGISVVKVFLNLSRSEQAQRFLARIERREKNWKFSAGDARERRYWDDYQVAFSEMLSHTSTQWAPWHVVPADHKWFARLATAAVLVQDLVAIDPQYPAIEPAGRREMAEVRAELLAELGGEPSREHLTAGRERPLPRNLTRHDRPVRDVSISDEMIRLGQLLKLAGLVGSGGDVKSVLGTGAVRVNGDVETRRGRQLHRGDLIALNGEQLRVV